MLRSLIQITIFKSVQDVRFDEYLKASGVYFMLCHDGAEPNTFDGERIEDKIEKTRLEAEDCSRKLCFRTMICVLINKAYNVALINGLEWMDTKARSPESLPDALKADLESFRSWLWSLNDPREINSYQKRV